MKRLTLPAHDRIAKNVSTKRNAGVWGWPLMLVLVVGLALSLMPGHLAAQSNRSVTWDRIDVTIELRDDSTLHVTERDTIIFQGGPFRTGFREIPLARVESIDQVQVGAIENGQFTPYEFVRSSRFDQDVPDTFTTESSGPNLRIRWTFPPVSSAERTWEIRYVANGALAVYPDAEKPFQQINWIGVGEEVT